MKYIKRVNLLLLACAVFLLVCGCNSTKSNHTLTGSWVLDFSQMTKEDSDFQALFDDDYDFLHSFSLYEDGTYSANMFDAHEVMLMYGKEASNRKQEIDRQHYTIPNQRPKDKHCGKI